MQRLLWLMVICTATLWQGSVSAEGLFSLKPHTDFVEADFSSNPEQWVAIEPTFNRQFDVLWLQQWGDDYKSIEGSRVARKIIHKSLSNWWDSYKGDSVITVKAKQLDQARSGSYEEWDYKIRFTSSKVQLKFEYEF